MRQPVDTTGYATVPAQVEAVLAVSDSMIEAGALPFVLPSASSGAGENYIALLEKISSKLIDSLSGTEE